MPLTFDQWKSATAAIPAFKQSPQLRELTTAFQLYALGPSPAKLDTFAVKFKAWNTSPAPAVASERAKVGATTIQNLQQTITGGSTGQAVKATGVKPMGWTLKAWTQAAYPWTSAVPANQQLGPLTTAEISRINEAFRRAKSAAELARDAMVNLAKLTSFAVSTPTARTDEAIYRDYFGAFDAQRIQQVYMNFFVLYLAFQAGPTVVDVRNTQYGLDCYAACFRHKLGSRDPLTKSVKFTGTVEVFLGRAFLGKGGYEKSTEDTVGTLVHEFAHGAINAVDAPPVDANNSWVLTPKSFTKGDNDYGESPDNSVQASTVATVKALAKKDPDIALVNADCYGQFAKEMVLRSNR